MNATMIELTDQVTAVAALRQVREALDDAVASSEAAIDALRETIVRVRPTGVLSVDAMAAAIGRDHNYIDSTWSAFGDTTTGKQTRVSSGRSLDEKLVAETKAALAGANKAQAEAAKAVKTARAERDRTVAMVYASKILGPSAIAAAVNVDRNHVLRIARKAGVQPMHREASRNQYSGGKPARRRRKPAAE